MIVYDCDQNSDDWEVVKAGIPSASMFDEIVTPAQCKESKQVGAAAFRKAYELKTGRMLDSFSNSWTDRGHELEPEARAFYEFHTDINISTTGVVFKNDKKEALCSPDGIEVPLKKGLEIKCPSPKVHFQYLYEGILPKAYRHQVFGSLWVCDDLDSWDFLSYHPMFDPFLITSTRDSEGYEKYANALNKRIPLFNEMVQEIMALKRWVYFVKPENHI